MSTLFSSRVDSLQWFGTVEQYISIEMEKAESKSDHGDERLRIKVLTLEGLKRRSAEFQWLYYSLCSFGCIPFLSKCFHQFYILGENETITANSYSSVQ